MTNLQLLIESRRFELTIMALIIINAVILGLETVPSAVSAAGPLLYTLDKIILGLFVVEIILKLVVYRLRFFRDPWRTFDFVIVGIGLIPATAGVSVLRALRILRVLRLISMMPSLRRVVGGLVSALPGMGSILALLLLTFYVFSVIATKLYGEAFPQWFGSLPASAFTLFQIMTLESWAMGIVRPVMEASPWAWVFFIPFIITTTFIVLNLFIGIIVTAMQREHEEAASAERAGLHDEQALILKELSQLRADIAALKRDRP